MNGQEKEIESIGFLFLLTDFRLLIIVIYISRLF
jgi:hypothetical protein